MTDQTRWGIDQVQQINKAKAYEDQKDMREELKKFVFNCNTFNLQKMYEHLFMYFGTQIKLCNKNTTKYFQQK